MSLPLAGYTSICRHSVASLSGFWFPSGVSISLVKELAGTPDARTNPGRAGFWNAPVHSVQEIAQWSYSAINT